MDATTQYKGTILGAARSSVVDAAQHASTRRFCRVNRPEIPDVNHYGSIGNIPDCEPIEVALA